MADVSTTTTIFLTSKRDVTATSTVLSLLVLSPAPFISLAFQWTRVYYHLSRGFFETSDVSTFLRRLHVNCMHHSSSLPSSPTTAVNLLVIRVRLFFASSSMSTNVTFVASTLFVRLSSGVLKRVLTMGRSRRGSANSTRLQQFAFLVNASWRWVDSRRVNYRSQKVRRGFGESRHVSYWSQRVSICPTCLPTLAITTLLAIVFR
jgi:hypothetical protein